MTLNGNNFGWFRISLESFRSFRGPLLLKPVTGQELFFVVSYSKPALTRIGLMYLCQQSPYTFRRPCQLLLHRFCILRVKKCPHNIFSVSDFAIWSIQTLGNKKKSRVSGKNWLFPKICDSFNIIVWHEVNFLIRSKVCNSFFTFNK